MGLLHVTIQTNLARKEMRTDITLEEAVHLVLVNINLVVITILSTPEQPITIATSMSQVLYGILRQVLFSVVGKHMLAHGYL